MSKPVRFKTIRQGRIVLFFANGFESCLFVEFLFPLFRAAIISEVVVPAVLSFGLVGRFDGAPIALSAGPDLDGESEKAIHVAAVEAVGFLDDVQIVEEAAVVDEIVLAPDRRDVIERQGGPVVDHDEGIQNDGRDNHHIDEGHREDVADVVRDGIFPGWNAPVLVAGLEGLHEDNAALVDGKAVFFGQAGLFFLQGIVKGIDFCQELFDS